MTQQLRALVGARVSTVRGAQKVSHYAQHETGKRWADERGHTVVGSFEDLDVSAVKFNPWSRPDLGQWLTDEHAEEWDVIVWAKIDRAFRSTRDCVNFAEWAKARGKIVVFAEDGLTLNYRDADSNSFESMMAELFVYLGSFFGQLEANRFKTRALDGHRVLRQTDRWASGVPPLGFKTVPHPSGKGYGLDTDTYGKQLLHDMAGMLLGGESFTTITAWLNDSGYLTSMDRTRVESGNDPRKRPWTVNNVIEALTSEKTQGVKMHNGKPVLNENGGKIKLAPATFDHDTWIQIQAAAAERRLKGKRRTHSRNPLLGVGVCGSCGASLAQQVSRNRGKEYRSYRCGRTPVNCKGHTMRANDAEELVEQAFLAECGDLPVMKYRFVPGEDYSQQLSDVEGSIARLRRESDSGLIVSEADEAEYIQRMKALVDKRSELEQLPSRKAGWIAETTDQTYAQAWHDADTEQRRKLLTDAGVTMTLYTNNETHIHTSQDVTERGIPGYDAQRVNAEREAAQAQARRDVGLE